ncbi:hypothetical protein PoB_001011400 [Plakobranchus ocellatus]|uniref:Uncharacterized protein n=1 Tax=Plakobranchus ocellatus TaxID=259542 RepID=A0AAV3YKP7_9GAST|nr:hypothetical protein PoB_001011400 [Plakobranchus ocellatus]
MLQAEARVAYAEQSANPEIIAALLASSRNKGFNDCSGKNYSMKPTEGEHISQLIAGYIKIILKKVSVSVLLKITVKHYNIMNAVCEVFRYAEA